VDDDEGLAASAGHRATLMDGFERVRSALDEFDPDVVIVFGDDQYENFQEDLIPPFAVLAYEDMDVQPWAMMKRRRGQNAWGEAEDTVFHVPGARMSAATWPPRSWMPTSTCRTPTGRSTSQDCRTRS